MTDSANYSWFWKNYYSGMEWIKKHEVTYWKSQAQALKAENDDLLQIIHDMQIPYGKRNGDCRSRCERKSNAQPEKSKRIRKSSESNQFEVSPEMLEFLKISIKHKKERQEEKDRAALANFLPPQEILELRRKEMEELYGESSSKILGMETAITLAFERYIDQHNPEYWPTTPMNLITHSH